MNESFSLPPRFAQNFPPSAHEIRVNRRLKQALAASVFGGLGLLSAGDQARAADECGAAGGTPPSITCADTALNPYAGGINYTTTTGFDLAVGSGIVVDRDPGYDFDGIHLDGFGDDLLRVTIATGVSVSTDGTVADGVQVHANGGNSDIEIISGANVTILNSLESHGIIGRIDDTSAADLITTSDGSILIRQLAGSTIDVRGSGFGIYGIHYGLGPVRVEAFGDVLTAGSSAFAISSWNLNPSATGAVAVYLADTGRVFTDGEEGVGIYALNYGFGAATIDVSGSIETAQIYSTAPSRW